MVGLFWKGSEEEHVDEKMKIDFEWKMEMEKVEKGRESESDKEGDLLSAVRGE